MKNETANVKRARKPKFGPGNFPVGTRVLLEIPDHPPFEAKVNYTLRITPKLWCVSVTVLSGLGPQAGSVQACAGIYNISWVTKIIEIGKGGVVQRATSAHSIGYEAKTSDEVHHLFRRYRRKGYYLVTNAHQFIKKAAGELLPWNAIFHVTRAVELMNKSNLGTTRVLDGIEFWEVRKDVFKRWMRQNFNRCLISKEAAELYIKTVYPKRDRGWVYEILTHYNPLLFSKHPD